jgi:tetratricopeptide (TPR) repeat protein
MVCWLDPDIDETNEDYQCSMIKLNEIVDSIQSFIDPDECIDFLTDMSNEQVFLIISPSFVQHIVPLIHEMPQLYTIYVFPDESKVSNEAWIKDYSKIRGFFTQIESIAEELKQDVHQYNHDTMSISFAPLSDSSGDVHLDQLDPQFMYSQLLKEILLELEYNDTSIKEFVNYCQEQFDGNNMQLKIIKTFETAYSYRTPVWWYTRESFIYSMLNRALRLFDIEITMKMGFFIRDLHQHIAQLHAEQFSEKNRSVFTVYRGQGLPEIDFKQMTRSRGSLISFNNFLSTSLDSSVSLKFAEHSRYNPGLVGILFKMTINPSISSAPFAAVGNVSYWQTENEVLFSMHTVFRIHEIKSISNRLYEVDLILTGDNDQELQMLTKHIRREIDGDTGFQRLGALMLEIGHYDKALELYETLLSTAHPHTDEQKISSMHNQLGAIYSRKGEVDKALVHYNKSLEIKLTYVSPNDSSLSAIYSNIGSALRNQNRLNEALEYMERALNTEYNASQSNPLKIASYCNNIGLVLTDQNRHNEALRYYEHALEIQQKYLPPSHPNLATSYNNIGAIYNELHDYDKALSFYEKSLAIMQRSLPSNHPDLAIPYNNLGAIYSELLQYSKALLYYEKSMEIMKNSLPSDHPSLAFACHNLALTHYRLQSYEIALQYGEKAVEICLHVLEPNDPQIIAIKETLNAIRDKL